MSVMPATASSGTSSSLKALTLVETKRLAKHPVFLLGVVGTAAFVPTSGGVSDDYYNVTIITGFFLGLFSMIAMFRLTRSMDRAEAAVDSTPASQRERTLALCLAAWLPTTLSVVALVVTFALDDTSTVWALGGLSGPTRFAIFFGNTVIACIGGPLLGVAAGRWWRFPGAVVALTVVVLFWVLLAEGLATELHDATWATFVHLSAPWAQFTSVDSDLNQLEVWRGSPWFYLGWSVSLCVLAVLGALLKTAEGADRQRLFRAGAVVGLIGLVFLTLGVFLGPEHALMHTPTGVGRY